MREYSPPPTQRFSRSVARRMRGITNPRRKMLLSARRGYTNDELGMVSEESRTTADSAVNPESECLSRSSTSWWLLWSS